MPDYRLKYTGAEIEERLDKVDELEDAKVVIGNTEPTEGILWIKPEGSKEIILAEIDDTEVSGEKTWSSNKIENQISDEIEEHKNNEGHITSAERASWNAKSNFSGNYNDLNNKPTIPSKTSQLTNDSGYITKAPVEVAVQSGTPSEGTLWVDTDEDEEVILAEIDDNAIDTEKTWSSSKINEEVTELNEKLVQETENLSKGIDRKADKIIATAQGTNIVVSDSSDDSVQNLKLYGKTTQGENPSLDNQQSLESVGKLGNLCNLPDGEQTTNGITVNIKDGVIKLSGNPINTDGFTSFSIGTHIATEEGKYTVSLTNRVNGIGIQFDTLLAGAINIPMSDARESVTAWVTSFNNQSIVLNVSNALTNLNKTLYVMLNEGTTPLSYRPYTGQLEIESGVYGGNLLQNMATSQTVNGVTFTVNNDGSITINGTATANANFALTPKNSEALLWDLGNVILSGNTVSSDISKFRFGFIEYESYIVSYDKGTGVEIDLTQKAGWFFIEVRSGFTVNTTIYPMLNYGSKALPYEQYTKQSHANIVGNGLNGIPLGQTIPDVIANSPIHMAGVYWDKEDGQYYISDTVDNESVEKCKRIDIANALSVQGKDSSGKLYLVHSDRQYVPLSNVDTNNGFVLSNCFIMKALENAKKSDYAITQYGTSFYIRNKDWETEEIANTSITEQKIQIMYILKNPIITPLTPEEIESYEALHSNYPYTTVMNNCDAHMEFEYDADTKCYIDNLEKKHNEEIAELRTAIIALGGTL